MNTFEEAAVARAAGVRQRADRPSQRRSAESGSSFRASFAAAIELRAKGEESDALAFEGLASATERGYEMWDMWGPYTEIVSAGAFADSLVRADLDVPLVLGHDQLRRIARTTNGTLQLEETDEGLMVRATLDPADTDVAYIAPKLRAGLIDEMHLAMPPVLLGAGEPLLADLDLPALGYACDRQVMGERACHVVLSRHA